MLGPMVDQIGTANHMISDKIKIDEKALRLLFMGVRSAILQFLRQNCRPDPHDKSILRDI
jgi:hypothetical protein